MEAYFFLPFAVKSCHVHAVALQSSGNVAAAAPVPLRFFCASAHDVCVCSVSLSSWKGVLANVQANGSSLGSYYYFFFSMDAHSTLEAHLHHSPNF